MTRLLAILLFSLLGVCTAQAQDTPACTGIDLLARLKTERPADYDAVIAEAEAVPNHEALFWKIERDDLAASYLLGTAHVTDHSNAAGDTTSANVKGTCTVTPSCSSPGAYA